MNLTLIDNCFFRLTTSQAKALCMDNKVPRPGYAMKANKEKLAEVKLGEVDFRLGPTGTWKEFTWKAVNAREAWVQRTPVQGKQVWALQLCY